MSNIFSSEKFPWFISLVLSIIYFITFIFAASPGIDFASSLLFGFCVWGAPQLPNEKDGCKNSPANSHIIAFGIDVLMTIAVYVLYKKDSAVKKQTLVYFAFAAIILLHGSLHFFLNSPIIDCYSEVDPEMEKIGNTLFAIFTFFLCLIILGFSEQALNFGVALSSVIFTAVVAYITSTFGSGEFILTGLFCVVHPLSSYAALKSNNPLFTSAAGWWFVVATTVGILELSTCESFFRSIGGHFYYDLTLHTSILLSTPYFAKDDNSKKIR